MSCEILTSAWSSVLLLSQARRWSSERVSDLLQVSEPGAAGQEWTPRLAPGRAFRLNLPSRGNFPSGRQLHGALEIWPLRLSNCLFVFIFIQGGSRRLVAQKPRARPGMLLFSQAAGRSGDRHVLPDQRQILRLIAGRRAEPRVASRALLPQVKKLRLREVKDLP